MKSEGVINNLKSIKDQLKQDAFVEIKGVNELIEAIDATWFLEDEVQKEAFEVASIMAKQIIHNPESAQKHIWQLDQLMKINFNHVGKPYVPEYAFFDFSQAEVKFIRVMIEQLTYAYYPFVVLARYLPAEYRLDMVEAVIEYADHIAHEMSWAMTAEACETLGYLSQKPVESAACLSRHLNDAGCDNLPAHAVLGAMPVFSSQLALFKESLMVYMKEGIDGADGAIYFAQAMSRLLVSCAAAKMLLPALNQLMTDWELHHWAKDQGVFTEDAESIKSLFALYGQARYMAELDDHSDATEVSA